MKYYVHCTDCDKSSHVFADEACPHCGSYSVFVPSVDELDESEED
jgi:rRNA maturation endonuclease Nob1